MRSQTLKVWGANAGTGAEMGNFYHPTSLALSVGCHFSMPPDIEQLHNEIAALDDAAVQLVAKEHSHFTFLACTTHMSETIGDLPEETAALISIFKRYAPAIDFKLRSLRLVPLPNALLLAGIPDQKTHKLRQEFAAEVLQSPFGHLIKARYQGYPIPPLVWHTTLMRYKRQYLPERMRRLYRDWSEHDFGSMHLGTVGLYAITFDWSQRHTVGSRVGSTSSLMTHES